MEIVNGKIVGTKFGIEDHGIMTFFIDIESDGMGGTFGGYALDTYDKKNKIRIGTGKGMDAVRCVLKTVGVSYWEDLKGKYVRCEIDDNKLVAIHNIIKNERFSLIDFYNVKENDKV